MRQKPWAEPLGQVLGVTGKIVEGVGDFIPGGHLIGGALSFGASLLNPEPTLEDLQNKLEEMQDSLASMANDKQFLKDIIEREMRDIRTKMENPPNEVRQDYDQVQSEMLQMMKSIRKDNEDFAEDVSDIKVVYPKPLIYLLMSSTK